MLVDDELANACSIILVFLTHERRRDDPAKTSIVRSEARVVSTRQRQEDAPTERGLRPKHLSEYIGQDRVKATLSIYIAIPN